jgi:hypothetical protein
MSTVVRTATELRSRYRRRPTRRRSIVAALVIGSMSAACGSSSGTLRLATSGATGGGRVAVADSATTTTTMVSRGTTLPSPSTAVGSRGDLPALERQLGAVLRGVFATRNSLSIVPIGDPESPLLATYATGEALEQLRSAIREKRSLGIARRSSDQGLSKVRVGAAEAEAGVATATACQVDDDVLYEVGSHAIVDDSVWSRSLIVHFVRIDGAWKVSSVETTQVAEGVAGCAQDFAGYPS